MTRLVLKKYNVKVFNNPGNNIFGIFIVIYEEFSECREKNYIKQISEDGLINVVCSLGS